MTKDDALVEAVSSDYTGADLGAADRRMLDFAAKLTRTPHKMEKADVEGLRELGFDDLAVHDIVVVASYYAFVNRVADGLGVELEPSWDDAAE